MSKYKVTELQIFCAKNEPEALTSVANCVAHVDNECSISGACVAFLYKKKQHYAPVLF